MAGFNTIVDEETGEFTLENLGDSYEVMEECFELIKSLTGGDRDLINVHLELLGFEKIKANLK